MSIAGKFFKARIGATTITGVTRAEMNHEADDLDATTADDDGYGNSETGVEQLTVRLSGLHKLDSGPFPTLNVGTLLTNLKVYLRGTTGAHWDIPSARVMSTTQPIEVRGRIEWTATIKSIGVFTPPVGA